jgi:hypothetical protein
MEDRRRVFTGVELVNSAEIAALVEKAAAGHSGGERKRIGERPTSPRSWHEPPLERDISDQAGTM